MKYKSCFLGTPKSLRLNMSTISGCWVISLLIFSVCLPLETSLDWGRSDQLLLIYSSLIFWGHRPFGIIFIWIICIVWFGHLSSSLNFLTDLSSGYWDIPFLIFGDNLHFKQSSILVWSPKLKFKISERSDEQLLRYSNLNILYIYLFRIFL